VQTSCSISFINHNDYSRMAFDPDIVPFKVSNVKGVLGAWR